MWEQLAMEDADQNKQCRQACINTYAPVHLDATHSEQDDQFNNYRMFVAATVQAIRRCILRATCYGNTPLRIKDLPLAFEMQWGTAFDMDNLGLQGTHDIADLLSLFPENFIVDRTTSDIPTVTCQLAGHLTRPIDDVITKMLWLRSHQLQPKQLSGCIDLYKKHKEVTLDGATDVYRQHCPLPISADIIANKREARQKAKWKTMKRHGGDVRTKRPSIRCRRQKVNLSEDLAHHHGCGCPACVVERAAEAYCFMMPEAKYSEIQQHYPRPLSASQPQVPHPGNSTEYRPKAEVKKRHLPWPRGSVEVSMRKLYKTKSSEDLFRCAEALFDQNITMPYNFKTKANPGSAGVYYNSQASAPIPGAPALPAGYPPPPNPEQSLFGCGDTSGGAGLDIVETTLGIPIFKKHIHK